MPHEDSNLPQVVILGAGGQGRVAAEALAQAGGARIYGFIDADLALAGSQIGGLPVVGDESSLGLLLARGAGHFHVGVGSVGDTGPRQRLFALALSVGLAPYTIVHPAAYIAPSAIIGPGSIVLARAVVHTSAVIGANVIVNTGAIVEHDCRIGDHTHIAPGAVLAGNTKVGRGVHVGLGASIIQRITIGDGALIAAGAVVVQDVPAQALAVGVPAKIQPRRK